MASVDVGTDRRPVLLGESETVNWFAIGFGGVGRSLTFSGKFSLALLPLNLRAASS